MQYFSALLSLGSLAAVATTVAAQQVPFVRDPAFPDCGNTLVTPKLFPPIIADPSPVPGTQRMMSKPYKSDSKSFFLTPGLGSCDNTYTNETMGVCLRPGHVHSALNVDGCGRQVALWLPGEKDYSKVKFARVVDACGAGDDADSKAFGCNDLYLTVELFKQLTPGDARADALALDAGFLQTNLSWAFTSNGPETDADCDDPTKKQASVIIDPKNPPKCA